METYSQKIIPSKGNSLAQLSKTSFFMDLYCMDGKPEFSCNFRDGFTFYIQACENLPALRGQLMNGMVQLLDQFGSNNLHYYGRVACIHSGDVVG